MEFLVDPHIGYLSIVGAIMFVILTFVIPRSRIPIVGVVLCIGLAWYEISQLTATPWALIMAVLSPLPFFIASRLSRMHLPLLLLTILTLTIGSYFIFTDQDGNPAVTLPLVGWVSVACALFTWIAFQREIQKNNERYGIDPNSIVEVLGEAHTEIHMSGMVLVEGELCAARSKTPIPAGSAVRVIRCNGGVLTVKKVERLTKE